MKRTKRIIQVLTLCLFSMKCLLGNANEPSSQSSNQSSKKVLILMPGSDAFTSSVAIVLSALKEAGYKITISTPSGVGPNFARWMKLGIDLQLYEGWSSFAPAPKQLEIFAKWKAYRMDPTSYDGLILVGGPARLQSKAPPTGMASSDPLWLFIHSKEFQDLSVEYMNAKKPLAALSHGVELLANATDPELETSVIYGRKITGPSKSLDRRMPLSRLLFGGTSATEEELRKKVKEYEDFIPGPTTRLESFKGFMIQDKNLLTARSARDAARLVREFDHLIESPQDREIRRYFMEYPMEKNKTIKLWIEVIEIPSILESKDEVFVEYQGHLNPLKDPQIQPRIDELRKGRRIVIWSLPTSGGNYGIARTIKFWSQTDIGKIRSYLESRLRTSPHKELIRIAVGEKNLLEKFSDECSDAVLKLVRRSWPRNTD